MELKNIIKYCNKNWKGDWEAFINMLQQKAFFAKVENKKVFAFDGLKDAIELEQMLVMADDYYMDNFEKLRKK